MAEHFESHQFQESPKKSMIFARQGIQFDFQNFEVINVNVFKLLECERIFKIKLQYLLAHGGAIRDFNFVEVPEYSVTRMRINPEMASRRMKDMMRLHFNLIKLSMMHKPPIDAMVAIKLHFFLIKKREKDLYMKGLQEKLKSQMGEKIKNIMQLNRKKTARRQKSVNLENSSSNTSFNVTNGNGTPKIRKKNTTRKEFPANEVKIVPNEEVKDDTVSSEEEEKVETNPLFKQSVEDQWNKLFKVYKDSEDNDCVNVSTGFLSSKKVTVKAWDRSCGICYKAFGEESEEKLKQLECQHTYHVDCIEAWV